MLKISGFALCLGCLLFAELPPEVSAAPAIGLGQAKQVKLPPDLHPEDTTAESIVIYTALLREIRRAERRNDLRDLNDLSIALNALRELHPKQTKHLQGAVTISISAVQQRKLDGAVVATTKRLRGPIRLVAGPEVLAPGRQGAFVVLLEKPAAKATTVRLTASELVGVPATLTIAKGAVAASFTATRAEALSHKHVHLIAKADGIEEVWELPADETALNALDDQ